MSYLHERKIQWGNLIMFVIDRFYDLVSSNVLDGFWNEMIREENEAACTSLLATRSMTDGPTVPMRNRPTDRLRQWLTVLVAHDMAKNSWQRVMKTWIMEFWKLFFFLFFFLIFKEMPRWRWRWKWQRTKGHRVPRGGAKNSGSHAWKPVRIVWKGWKEKKIEKKKKNTVAQCLQRKKRKKNQSIHVYMDVNCLQQKKRTIEKNKRYCGELSEKEQKKWWKKIRILLQYGCKGGKGKKNQEYGCELSAKEKQKKTGEEYCCAFSNKAEYSA